MDKRKIYFWISYAVSFAVLFFVLWTGYFTFVPVTNWTKVIFVILLFIIVSPVSTIVSTKITNRIFGPENK